MKFRNKWQRFLLPQTRSFLGWSQHLFLVIGILALGCAALTLLDAKLFQVYETWRFDQALEAKGPSIARGDPLILPPLPIALATANQWQSESLEINSSPLGRIEISKIGLTVMILEGIDNRTLRRGVGHVPGTSLPGQQGNVAIAGHRDTFFRPLRKVSKNDEIILTTMNGSYCYQVDYTQVVEPEDIKVLADSDEAILTLVTCYPFSFVGPAPKRFIVRAHRVPG
jgi:sortase A